MPSCVGYTSTGPRITPGLVQFEQLLVVAGHTSPRSTSCLLGRYPVPRPCRLRPKELSGREPRRVNCTSLLARGGALRTERSNNELVRSKVEHTLSVQPAHSLGDRLQRGVARDVSQ